MKPLELLRRAAGKSPGYLARRALLEARRRIRSRAFRRRLGALDGASLCRETGVESLAELWRRHGGQPYRLDPGQREDLRRLYAGPLLPERQVLRSQVERILAHEFDLLGSGPTALGAQIDWHRDFKSGRRWDLVAAQGIDYAQLGQPSDVKVPWELSRAQHFATLGRAWVVERDERCVRELERQLRSWIRGNPVGVGVNWACTMDVALRAVSWIWALGLFDDAPVAPDVLEEALLSLYRHGLWIAEHLEIGEVKGNHFLSDAVGLVACGAVFRETRDGREWLEHGAKLLEREILAQTEEDGVDIEASVPYHRLVLELFLVGARFLEAAGREMPARYRERLRRMLAFVHAYTTPEGLSPVIGDADDGRALVLGATNIRDHRYLLSTGAVLFKEAAWKGRAGKLWEDSLWLLGPKAKAEFDALESRTEEATQAFPQSGFYVLRCPHQYLFVDAGPVGF
ncbi:MAG: heparinase II/III family protein, partial [Thermoanaerobaculia bacterium]